MKSYEAAAIAPRFDLSCPVYARLDGRAFSSFTRGLIKPYDPVLGEAMIRTAEALLESTHARAVYVQSDEISLLWHPDTEGSSIMFDGRLSKMTSALASFAAVAFARCLFDSGRPDLVARLPHFDARVCSLPNRGEAVNMFLWRMHDARRNAISLAAQTHFSHKYLHGLNGREKLAKLDSCGVNFDDYPEAFRFGTLIRRGRGRRPFTEDEIAAIPIFARPDKDASVTRAIVQRTCPDRSVRFSDLMRLIFPEPVKDDQEAGVGEFTL